MSHIVCTKRYGVTVYGVRTRSKYWPSKLIKSALSSSAARATKRCFPSLELKPHTQKKTDPKHNKNKYALKDLAAQTKRRHTRNKHTPQYNHEKCIAHHTCLAQFAVPHEAYRCDTPLPATRGASNQTDYSQFIPPFSWARTPRLVFW